MSKKTIAGCLLSLFSVILTGQVHAEDVLMNMEVVLKAPAEANVLEHLNIGTVAASTAGGELIIDASGESTLNGTTAMLINDDNTKVTKPSNTSIEIPGKAGLIQVSVSAASVKVTIGASDITLVGSDPEKTLLFSKIPQYSSGGDGTSGGEVTLNQGINVIHIGGALTIPPNFVSDTYSVTDVPITLTYE